jgi:hypothetical protein
MTLVDVPARGRRSRPPAVSREYPLPSQRSEGYDPPSSPSSGRALALVTRGRLASLPPTVPLTGAAGLAVLSAGGAVDGPPAPSLEGAASLLEGGDYAGRLTPTRRLRPPERAAELLLPWAIALASGSLEVAPEDPSRTREVQITGVAPLYPSRGWQTSNLKLRLTSRDWDLLRRAVREGGAGWTNLTGTPLRVWALSLLERVFREDASNPVDAP